MTVRRLRAWGILPLAVVGTAALGVAPALTPVLVPGLAAAKTVVAEAALLDTESWIMGGSGLPIPPPSYLTALSERYINPSAYPDFNNGQPSFIGQPTFPVSTDNVNPLFTPEGLYPFTGVKNLELDTSAQQGVSILNSTITNQVAAGNPLVVLGYSQSATISSLEMKDLLAMPQDQQPTAEQLAFVLLGDPSNPNGGLLSRFDFTSLPTVGDKLPELTVPSLGITFSGATPAGTPWDTAIYSQEYDGFADFPKYPLNFLADLNALLGILEIHGNYPSLTADQIGTSILLPGSADNPAELPDGSTTAADATNYYMIPTHDLPLLDLIRGSSFGNAIADLLQPDLKIMIDMGYGNLDTPADLANGTGGWDTGPANLPTPFGLAPPVDSSALMTALSNGAQQGMTAFTSDLSHMSTTVTDAVTNGATTTALPSLTDIVNAFSGGLSSLYSALLPTADITNALVTTLPTYDFDLFSQYLSAGDLQDALGMPAAFTTGLTTLAAGFELIAIENAFSGFTSEFSGL
ncbi:MAG: PE-PPE domain-containing protein [Mycobacterium sp.]